MIVIETNRVFAVYVRTNRRVRWQFAEYCGRWESLERAISEAKARTHGTFEYRIEDMSTGKIYQQVVTC